MRESAQLAPPNVTDGSWQLSELLFRDKKMSQIGLKFGTDAMSCWKRMPLAKEYLVLCKVNLDIMQYHKQYQYNI